MKAYLKRLLICAASVAFAPAAFADQLVIGAFGGSFADNVKTCYVASFEKATGSTVGIKLGLSSQFAGAMRASAGNPDVDLVFINDSTALQLGNEGLLQSIDSSKLQHAAQIPAQMFGKNNQYVTFMVGATAIVYDPKKVSPAPTSWLDLYDPKFKGKMALPDFQGLFGMHLLLALNKIKGGTFDNISPGVAAMKELVPNSVTFYTAADQIVSMFERGEIVIAPWTPDRAGVAMDKGLSLAVAYPKEGAVGILPSVVLPKGSKKSEVALKFLDIILSPEAQSCFAEKQYAGPVNRDAKLSEKTSKLLPTQETFQNLIVLDPAVVAKNSSEWGKRWQREIAN